MADPNEMTLSLFESRFKNRQYIGSGGFAKVYKAFDHAKNHYVALKVADVRPEYKQFTLQREVELVNKLPPHPNIARYDACYRFDMGVAGEIDFAILKFYEDGNLEQFITTRDVTPDDIRIIIKGILRGVSFLHNNNYVHRDMKAQNILIQRDDGVWTPKITDFGLSRSMGADNTTNNSAIGMSYAYAAPEQIQNRKIYKNVDIWAVGVIIYRVLTGEIPFRAHQTKDGRDTQSQLELSRKIINVELPERLNTLQEPYQTMIRRCLIADPKVRCQSAEELLNILDGEKPFAGNFQEEEDSNPSFRQPYKPTLFVPVEPEQQVGDEKTKVIQLPEPLAPYQRTPEPATPYQRTTEPPTPYQRTPEPAAPYQRTPEPPTPYQRTQEPAPVYTPQPDYIIPKPDYTQIIGDQKKEAPPPPPPPPVARPSLNLGEPAKRSNWLWYVIPLLLIGAGWAAYKLFYTPKQAVVQSGIKGKSTAIPTYEVLRKNNEEARGDLEKLSLVGADIEKSVLIYPNDYLRRYELAKNYAYREKDIEAFDELKKAALLAIEQNRSNAMVSDLNRDRERAFRKLSNGTHVKWNLMLEGIKERNKFLINGLRYQ